MLKLAFFFLFITTLSATASDPCTIFIYGSLYHLDKIPVVTNLASGGGDHFNVSVCQQAPSSSNCSVQGCNAYTIDGLGNCICVGKNSSLVWSFIMDNMLFGITGVSTGEDGRTFIAKIECGDTDEVPSEIVENPARVFTATWKSRYACYTATCLFDVRNITFDLTSMGYAVSVTVNDMGYSLSPCAIVAYPSRWGYIPNCVGFQLTVPIPTCLGNVSLGYWESDPNFLGVKGTFAGGTDGRKFVAEVECSWDEEGPATIIESPQLTFTARWRSKLGCPHSNSAVTVFSSSEKTSSSVSGSLNTKNNQDQSSVISIVMISIGSLSIVVIVGLFIHRKLTSTKNIGNYFQATARS